MPGPVGTQQEQAITFPAIADLSVLTAPFNLSATASSGMPVTYSIVAGGGSIALVGSTVLLLAPGSVTLRASQAGNADVAPANPVDRTFLVIGANNGTLGADQSLWYDVNGDGIRDEIIRPNTNRARLSITSTQFGSGWLNSFWTWRPTYYTPFQGTEPSASYPEFGWSWSISASLADLMFDSGGVDVSAWLNMDANYDYVFFQTGENNIANWPQAQINSLPRFLRTVAGTYYWWLALNAQVSDYLDSAIFPIRLSQPIGSIQINDSGGNTIIGNLAVNGTAELILPSNNQVTLQVRDTANQFVSSTIHQIAWQLLDELGNILRIGTGLNIDFDGLPVGTLVLALYQGTSPVMKKVTVKVAKFQLEFQNSGMSTGKIIDPLSPPISSRLGAIEGDSVTFRARITPNNASLQQSDYTWSGFRNGTGESINVTFVTVGSFTQRLDVTAAGFRTARITVMDIALFSEASWLAAHPSRISSAFALRDEALAWANANQTALGGGLSNGRADAARHAYWSALMTIEWNSTDAEGLGSAHERTNYNDGGAHNEIVMDLENNLRGRTIGGANTTRAAIESAIFATLNSGLLTILDDTTNTNGSGLLKASNL